MRAFNRNYSNFYQILIGLLIYTLMFSASLFGAVTGKISGRITDQATGEVLIGANVILEGTSMGAATDINGYYVILNINPGIYTIRAMMIGYAPVNYTEVRVNVDLTTTVDFGLQVEYLQGEEIVVVSQRKMVRLDVASSQLNISNDRIEDLPVTTLEGVIGLQAGIEGMSVRSGGENELAVTLDGASLKDDRTGKPIMGIPLNSVQEIMIQSGGFNAEYSDLQAGVINIITKEGSVDRYSFSINYKYSPPALKYHGESVFSPNSYFLRPFMDDDVCWTGTKSEKLFDTNGNYQWDEGESFEDTDGDGQYYQSAWDEYTQSQYPSFDGWNALSEELCTDPYPDNDLTPEAAQRLFKWQHRRAGDIVKPDFNIDAGFGGPVPFVSKALGNLRFYTSYRQEQDMYLIPLSREAYKEWTWSTKITSDISPKIKLQLTSFLKEISAASLSSSGNPNYFESLWDVAGIFGGSSQNHSKIWYPEYYSLTDLSNRMYSAKLTNMLSNKSYYEGLIEYSFTGWDSYPGDTLDDGLNYDIFPGADNYYVDESPFGFNAALVEGIGGATFLMGGKTTSRDNTTTSRLKFRFDFTTQANQNNQLKTGAELIYYSYHMDYGSVIDWSPTSSIWTEWKQNPYQFNTYIQDKLEFKGWIATVGLRMEYFNPNTDWYVADIYDKDLFSSVYVSDEENDLVLEKVDGSLTFLPRIGISHPITTNSKLYFNYGHMRQKFLPDYLFGIRRGYGNVMSRYGDPTLPMEKTVAYELGYDHALFDQYLLHIAAYYKDKSDQAGSVHYISADNSVNYRQYENNFYQDIRGLEIEFRKRSGDWLTGFVNYTYNVATSGTFGLSTLNQSPSEQRAYEADVDDQSQNKPLARPKFNCNLALHTPRKWGPSFIGGNPLGGWTVAFTGYWKAGSYSSYGGVSGITNNVRWVDTYGANFKGSKSVDIKRVRLTFVCDIYNVFNFKFLSLVSRGDQYLSPGDYTNYVESLQFPKKVYDDLGQPHLSGDDRLGAYRPNDIKYQEMLYIYHHDAMDDPRTIYYVGELDQWMQLNDAGVSEEVTESKIDKLLEDKAYIDNPNIESLMFLNPRNIYFGIKLSFDL